MIRDTGKLVGHVVNGRYRISEFLGKGGSGNVFKAWDEEADRPVALKVLKDLSLDDPEVVIRFNKEVAVSARLSSPHNVRVFEFGKTEEGFLIIAMEYLDGHCLNEVIKAESPLVPGRAIGLMCQALEAVAEAHDMGVVHRDIKPENMFVLPQPDGTELLKVLDYGIAKFLHEDVGVDTLTRDGFFFGTPLYISPEQALGWRVTTSSDIYSLGVVFFEMLTGTPPFHAESAMGLGMKHIYEPPPLDLLRPVTKAGAELKKILSLMLEKRPERRPGSARDILKHLAYVQANLSETLFEVVVLPADDDAEGARERPTVKVRPIPDATSEFQPDDVDGGLSILGEQAEAVEVQPAGVVEETFVFDAESLVEAENGRNGKIQDSPWLVDSDEEPDDPRVPMGEDTSLEIPADDEESAEEASPPEPEIAPEPEIVPEPEVAAKPDVITQPKVAAKPKTPPKPVASRAAPSAVADEFGLISSGQGSSVDDYVTVEIEADLLDSPTARRGLSIMAWGVLILALAMLALLAYVLFFTGDTAPASTPSGTVSTTAEELEARFKLLT